MITWLHVAEPAASSPASGGGRGVEQPTTALINRTFVSNLALAEATGSDMQAITVDRFLESLRPTQEQRRIFLIALELPEGALPEGLPRDPCGFPTVPSTGDDPVWLLEHEALAYLVISVPLLQDTSSLWWQVDLDAEFLPLPGERYSPEAERILDSALGVLDEVAAALHRTHLYLWNTVGAHCPVEEAPLPAFLASRGCHAVHREAQYSIEVERGNHAPEAPDIEAKGVSLILYTEDGCPEHALPALCQLSDTAEWDIPAGDIQLEPSPWTPERIRDAERIARVGGHRSISALLIDEDGAGVALSTIAQHRSARPEIAEQNMTVVARNYRGRGLGAVVKKAALAEAARRWPRLRRVGTSVAVENAAMNRINESIGMQKISQASAWLKQAPLRTDGELGRA